jgi:hypothetical protein
MRHVADDATLILRHVQRWSLDDARWSEAEQALEHLDAALSAGDEQAAVAALDQLSTLGPTRLAPQGFTAAASPPPARVLEHTNKLLHALAEDREDDPAEPPQERLGG